MRILAVVSYFPLPMDHGDALRRSLMLDSLSDLGDLTIACARRRTTTEKDVAALRTRFPHARILVRKLSSTAGPSIPAKIARSAMGILTQTPPWIYQQWSRALNMTLGELPKQHQHFDVAILIGEGSAAYSHSARRLSDYIVWDKSNVLTASNLNAVVSSRSGRARLRALVTLGLSFLFERRHLKNVDAVWVTSAQEDERLQRHFRRKATAVIPSTVKRSSRRADFDPSSTTLAWVSTLSYAPNWDGLLKFLKSAADELKLKGMTLRVIGAGATAEHKRTLSRYEAVDFWGYAEDLAEALHGVRVGIVPVWTGAGVKLKSLTLLDLGVPVVSTSVGFEGIPPQAAAAITDDPVEMVTLAASLSTSALRNSRERAGAVLDTSFSANTFSTRVHTATLAALISARSSANDSRTDRA